MAPVTEIYQLFVKGTAVFNNKQKGGKLKKNVC
jgi:hypothetical protein